MARWLILGVTFLIWSASLGVVYVYCSPEPMPPEAQATRQTLELIFSDTAPRYTVWRVYLNPHDLSDPNSTPNPADTAEPDNTISLMQLMAAGQGAEPGEMDVGFMVSTVKRRDQAVVELSTAMKISLLSQSASPLMNVLSPLLLDSRSNISADEGILDFFMRVTTGVGIEVQATGFRDRQIIRATQTIFNRDKVIGEMPCELPAKDLSVPSVSPAPLSDRGAIQPGQHWPVLMIEAGRSSSKPHIVYAEAHIKEKLRIQYHGREEEVYLAEAVVDRNTCFGWYTPAGRLLKQHFHLADLLDVTLIRSERDDPDPTLPEPGWGAIFPKKERLESPKQTEDRLGS